MNWGRGLAGGALCAPLVHFFVLGGLLFAFRSAVQRPLGGRGGELQASGGGLAAREPLVLSAERVAALRSGFAVRWGSPPSPAQLSALVDETVDEELLEREARRLDLGLDDRAIRRRLIGKMRAVAADLAADEDEHYRQGLALGLDDDVVVRRQLREKMRLLLRRAPSAEEPSEAELAAGLERHRDRFARPATASFTQVFVSAAHGAGAAGRAAAVAAEIRARALGPDAAAALADAFPLDARWNGRTRAEIARRFGETFAGEVLALDPGVWSPPIASPYGLHLVWVHDRSPGGPPALDEVRGQVTLILAEERAAARLAEGLRRLRDLYEVRVEWPETAISEARP